MEAFMGFVTVLEACLNILNGMVKVFYRENDARRVGHIPGQPDSQGV